MSELEKAQQQLEEILDRIPASGSFESARLAKKASVLTDRITVLCARPDSAARSQHQEENTGQSPKGSAKE